jgi:hypothetical protein
MFVSILKFIAAKRLLVPRALLDERPASGLPWKRKICLGAWRFPA